MYLFSLGLLKSEISATNIILFSLMYHGNVNTARTESKQHSWVVPHGHH